MKKDLLQRGFAARALLALAGYALIAVPSALEAQRSPEAELASVSVHQGGLGIAPQVSAKGAIITISGAGQTFTRRVEGGGYISIDTFNLEGEPLPDGPYTWGVQLLPDEATAGKLRVATNLNGGETPNPWNALTGTFAIRNGSIADPNLVEPGPVHLEQVTVFGPGVELGAAQVSAVRVAAEDSDAAVEAGSVEGVGGPSLEAGAAVVGIGGDRTNVDDSDELVAAGTAAERRQVLSWAGDAQSAGQLEEALAIRQVKPADGSNGREPGSTPDN